VTRRGPARGARRLYLFALCRSSAPVPAVVGRHRLERIAIGAIAAIAERRASVPSLSERSLRDQHRVVVALHRQADALIPVRFGALLERDELERIVRRRRSVLARALTRVRGKAQMTIRVAGPARLRPPASTSSASGTAYLAERARAARPFVPPDAEAVRLAVRALVVDESIEAGRGGAGAVIHHLIRARDADAYLRRAGGALSEVPSDTLTISGPWPAFAFAPEIMDAAG
jgi:hypothetical protein